MSELAGIRAELGEEARIVFVSGNFNVLHPGHVRLLRFAKELGDHLVVGINPDNYPGAETPAPLRLESVASNRFVTHAVALSEDATSAIRALRPQIVVKGREHENLPNPELVALEEYGGQLIFSSGDVFLSTFSVLNDDTAQQRPAALPLDFMQRHGISRESLAAIGKQIADTRMLVIGDLIIDEYIDCDPLGMSQEDPTIVVTPIDHRKFVGGAGIVAAHARGLGASVDFVTTCGDDDMAGYAEEHLAQYGVTAHLLADSSRPTTLKQRFRANEKTLLRVSHLRQHAISRDLGEKVLEIVRQQISDTQLILFSDFNYGCLPGRLVDEIVKIARDHDVPMMADSQASSQLSDITRFQGMRLITPTELEARLALKERSQGLVVVGEKLLDAAQAQSAIVTLGAEGLIIFDRTMGWDTDRIAALNLSPRDVAGAGDSLFCATSLALATGSDIWHASLFGAIVASYQVGRVGNKPVQLSEIMQSLAPDAT